MNEHLEKVMKIVQKYGLDPMIWSDMYFRAISKTGDYYDQDVVIPKELAANIPQNVQLVYWDYEHQDKNTYSVLINKHKELGSTPIFAGGIWCWNGYTVDYDKTFITTNPALMACKEAGVEEVIATIWGMEDVKVTSTPICLACNCTQSMDMPELDLEKLKSGSCSVRAVTMTISTVLHISTNFRVWRQRKDGTLRTRPDILCGRMC